MWTVSIFGMGAVECQTWHFGTLTLACVGTLACVSITRNLRGARRFVKWIRERGRVCETGSVPTALAGALWQFGTPSRKSCWHI